MAKARVAQKCPVQSQASILNDSRHAPLPGFQGKTFLTGGRRLYTLHSTQQRKITHATSKSKKALTHVLRIQQTRIPWWHFRETPHFLSDCRCLNDDERAVEYRSSCPIKRKASVCDWLAGEERKKAQIFHHRAVTTSRQWRSSKNRTAQKGTLR